jgi:hypothetical protein
LAAAYAVGAAAAAAEAGAEAMALAAPAGPFGVIEEDGTARPILHALAALHGAAEQAVRAETGGAVVGLRWDGGAVLANASLRAVTVAAPFATGAVLGTASAEAARDPGWLRGAAGPLAGDVTLGPCEVLFAGAAARSL